MNSGVIVLSSKEECSLHLRPAVRGKTLICADLCQVLVVVHGWYPWSGLCWEWSSPRRNFNFFPLQKSFTFLNIYQSQDIWDLNFTRGFSAAAIHVGVCYGKRSTSKKKKRVLFVNLFAWGQLEILFLLILWIQLFECTLFLFKYADFISWPKPHNAILIYMLR